MEPIISPWLIWIISTLDGLESLCKFLALASVFATFVSISYWIEDELSGKVPIIIGIIALVFAIIVIIIPSRTDMLTMLTLQYITPDNITLVQDNIVDFVQKVMEACKGVK